MKSADGLRITEGWLNEATDLGSRVKSPSARRGICLGGEDTRWWQPTQRRTTHAVYISPVIRLPSEPFPITEADLTTIRGAMTHYLQDPSLRTSFRRLRPVEPRLKETDYVVTEVLWAVWPATFSRWPRSRLLLYGVWLALWRCGTSGEPIGDGVADASGAAIRAGLDARGARSVGKSGKRRRARADWKFSNFKPVTDHSSSIVFLRRRMWW